MLKTESLIVLPVALGNGKTVIDIVQPHPIVGDITDKTTPTTTTEGS